MIYFVQAIVGGPIKIGTTENLDVRLKQLERGYGQPLALLGTQEGGRDEEESLHGRFSHLRLGRTEQFRPDPELLEFIGKPLFVSMLPVVAMAYDRKPVILQMRGSQAWKDWVEAIAEKEGDAVAKLFERAMRKFAKDGGYPDPPRR